MILSYRYPLDALLCANETVAILNQSELEDTMRTYIDYHVFLIVSMTDFMRFISQIFLIQFFIPRSVI